MRLTILMLALSLTIGAPAAAQTASDELTNCLTKHTNATDRQAMTRWVFVTMSSHPDLQPYTSTQATQEAQQIQGQMAQILTRLITESCAKETKQALRQGGPASIQKALTTVARQALTDLIAHPNVSAQLGGTVKQIDPGKWARLLLTP
jgi:hypothetical protein